MKSRISSENGQASAKGTASITEGVIWKQLLLFFFPILFGTFFQQLYNTADAVIVGRYVGKEALAAVGGSTAMIINLMVGFFVGLSSGATVIISQFFGAQNEKRVSEAVHTAMAFSLVCGLIMTAGGVIFARPVLTAMGNPEDIMEDSMAYMQIYFFGVITNLIYNMGSGILRAIGDSRRPLYYLIASCFTNIMLDLAFVVVLNMGVRGAAMATVCSQLVSAVLVSAALMRTDKSYKLILRNVRLNSFMVRRIVQIGFPAGLQSVMYSVSNIIIQRSVNALGTDTIAAWSAYSKIDSVYWMVLSALGISITTFVGQNYGAGRMDRVRRGVLECLGLSAVITIGLSAVLYNWGGGIYRLFTNDAAVLARGMEILHFLAPAFILYVCIEIYSGALRGVGDCWIPMIITAMGVCVLRILWVVIVVPFKPAMSTIIISYPMSWAATTALFNVYYFWFSSLKRFSVTLPWGRRKRRKR